MHFCILGTVEARRGGVPVGVGGPRQRALLGYLLVHAGELVTTERLVDELWSGAPSAVKSVQVTMSRLRRSLGDDVIASVAGGYRLEAQSLDSAQFESLLVDARLALSAGDTGRARATLREALGLWRDRALGELALQPWATDEARRLDELRLDATETLMDCELRLGQHSEMVPELQRLVAEHPLRERLQGQLMLALYRSGRQAAALDVYRTVRKRLVEELGLEPSPALRRLEAAILRHDPSLIVQPSASNAAAAPPTPTIGREADLATVRGLLYDPSVRLVTLTGTGGVGKTRLAVELAREAGTGVVALAAVERSEFIAGAIARSLAVTPLPGESQLASIIRRLSDGEPLLVLDNFEHLLDGAGLVTDLLGAVAGVRVLVTSREPLGLLAEHVWTVPPLALPASDDPGRIAASPAVELFVQRARARLPGFTLDADGTAAVGHICARLDGLPLAIELAAARVSLLAPRELAARVDQALSVLGSGPRDAPERHRTLRAAIEWSYRLLDERERITFARLAVFVGGTETNAAERVTGASLDVLDGLVRKSLVATRGDRQRRLFMLEAVREYALERLDERGERDQVHLRHCDEMTDIAETLTPEIERAGGGSALERMKDEAGNFEAALGWATTVPRTGSRALRLALALDAWWRFTFVPREAINWLKAALAVASPGEPVLRARALESLSWHLHFGGNYGASLDHARDAVSLYRTAGETSRLPAATLRLAWAAAEAGDELSVKSYLSEALNLTGTSPGLAVRARLLAAVVAGDADKVATHATTAVALARCDGREQDIAQELSNAGWAALQLERDAAAAQLLSAAEPLAAQLSERVLILLRGNQGLALLFTGDDAGAGAAFRESLARASALGLHWVGGEALLGLAALAARTGAWARAARLAGAAAAGFREVPAGRTHERVTERFIHPSQRAAPQDAWTAAWAEGESLDLSDAAALALRPLNERAATA